MRILTLIDHLGPGGGLEITQLANCRNLASRGHEIDVVYSSPGSFTPDWESLASSLTRVEATLPRRKRPVRSAWDVARGVWCGARRRPDVVYVYRYLDLPFAAAVATVRGSVLAYHLCLPPPETLPAWLAGVLPRVDVTLTVSADTARRWEGTGLPASGVVMTPTAVDLDRFSPAAPADRPRLRASLGLPAEAFIVLYCGRISPEKGVPVLLEAVRLLAARSACQLVILGSPNVNADPGAAERHLGELHHMAAGLPVLWRPRTADVVPWLRAADVAVVPSLWPEPLARSILEPMACGTPVVATRVGGSPELLKGWMSDLLFEPGRPDALAGILTTLQAEDRLALGRRLRREAEYRISPAGETDLIEGAMRQALSRRRRGRGRDGGPPCQEMSHSQST